MNLYLIRWTSGNVILRDHYRAAESLAAAGEGLVTPSFPAWAEEPVSSIELVQVDIDLRGYTLDGI